MTLNLRENTEGVTLPVKAKPGAKRTALLGEHGGALKISVAAPPEDGQANAALLEFLGELLKLHHSELELLTGHSRRDKVVLIRNRSVEMVRSALASPE